MKSKGLLMKSRLSKMSLLSEIYKYKNQGNLRDNPEQRLQEWFSLYLMSLGVLFCASAGGMRTNMRTAIKMKRAGYRKGFPDMEILEPRGDYHGLFVELKCGSRPTPEQLEWQKDLIARGYLSLITPSAYSFQQAQNWLEEETKKYLSLRKRI